jgi:hypothetical protein
MLAYSQLIHRPCTDMLFSTEPVSARPSAGLFTAEECVSSMSHETHKPSSLTFSIDEWKPMKVVCIGAGYSGIIAGIRCVLSLDIQKYHLLKRSSGVSFAQRIPNVDLTIYEKEDDVGGTWYVNRYPVSTRYTLIW